MRVLFNGDLLKEANTPVNFVGLANSEVVKMITSRTMRLKTIWNINAVPISTFGLPMTPTSRKDYPNSFWISMN